MKFGRMLTRPLWAIFLLQLSTGAVPGKDKQNITIQVVDTQTSQREFSYDVPGTPAESKTNCNSDATAISLGGGIASANGTTNCTTKTTPATPPTTVVRSIPQAHVHAIMPNGTHITLWCQQGFRRCSNLSQGSYSAEVDGNSVWIYAHDLGGKEYKVKYRYVGGWSGEEPSVNTEVQTSEVPRPAPVTVPPPPPVHKFDKSAEPQPSNANAISAQRESSQAAPSNGRLVAVTVASSPSGGIVYFEDAPIGRTPTTALLMPGQYALRISGEGYLDWVGTVTVEVGKPFSVAAQLQPR